MTTWTPLRTDALRAHIARGLSASQSAKLLGISRSAAIGKSYRLGLSFKSGGEWHRQAIKRGLRGWWSIRKAQTAAGGGVPTRDG